MGSNIFKKLAALLLVAIVFSQPIFAADTYKNREDIPERYKWSITDIYKTNEDFEKAIDFVENTLVPKIVEYKGKLNKKENLLECLKERTKYEINFDKIYNYATFFKDVDISDQSAHEIYWKALVLYQKTSEALSFIKPELLSQDESVMRAYISDPDFKDYVRFLDILLEEKQHSLSAEEETLIAKLSLVAQSPLDIYSMLVDVDLEYPEVCDPEGNTIKITNGNYSLLLEHPDRDFRKTVFESVNGEYRRHNNTFASTLAALVNVNVFFADAYNYDSALEASLGSDIPVSVYDNLISSVNNGLSPLHRYMSLRKDVLGLEKIHPYDVNISLVSEQTEEVSYDDAKSIVLEALEPLGKDYIDVLKKAFDDNWIDVYETPGKMSGAYSGSVYSVHPYVLLNYNGSFYDISTIAHELGHSVHQYYSSVEQPYEYSGVTIFTTEVASTANEILLHKYMINNAETNAEKLYYVNSLLDLYVVTFYSQSRYAEFEKFIYDTVESGNTLSAETMNLAWLDSLTKYNGEAYEAYDLAAFSWARIPHFYYNFYVYQYATSIAAANQLVTGIIENKPGTLEKYLEFLQSGSLYDSITTLANMGIDMESPQVFDDFINEFDLLVTEMERLLILEGKIADMD